MRFHFLRAIAYSSFFLSISLFADDIKIYNKTDRRVYAMFYYTKGTISEKDSRHVLDLGPGTWVSVARPERRLYLGGVYDRDLYFSFSNENAEDFPRIITKGTRRFVNVGDTRGSEFYIAVNEDNELDGYNLVTWNTKPVKAAVTSVVYEQIRKNSNSAPYVNQNAQVRKGNTVASDEQRLIQARLQSVKSTIQKLIGAQNLTDAQTPRIAFCGSGGGYRAMLCTAGFLKGAQQIGLYDAALYNAGLSGSTWAITGLLQSGKTPAVFADELTRKLSVDIKNGVNSKQVSEILLRKLAFNQPISLIDVWGSLIAQKVLAGMGASDPNAFTIAGLADKLAHSPFPICTALISQRGVERYEWVEFTPYEVSSPFLGCSIPTWAFGRKFENGQSVKQGFSIYPPPASLGFGMGIWGSAVSVNAKDLVDQKYWGQSGIDAKIAGLITDKLKGSAAIESRVLPAQVFNWAYGMQGIQYNNLPAFHLVDAGIDYNLPLPPLLRRERPVDIIIVFDASGSVVGKPAEELKKAEAYAKTRGLKFPKIDYTTTKNVCSIHYGDPKFGIPTIIYLPFVANSGYQNGWYLDPEGSGNPYTSTFNFMYSEQQAKQLSGLTEFSMVASKQIIVEAITVIAKAKGATIPEAVSEVKESGLTKVTQATVGGGSSAAAA